MMLGFHRRRNEAVKDESRARLMEEIRQARRERDAAQGIFETAVEFDRIDHAIYTLEAAEKKLDILLREAKQLWGESDGDTGSKQRIVL